MANGIDFQSFAPADQNAWQTFLNAVNDPTGGYQQNSFFNTPTYQNANQAYQQSIRDIWNPLTSLPWQQQDNIDPDQLNSLSQQYNSALNQSQNLAIPNGTSFLTNLLTNPIPQIFMAAYGGSGLIGDAASAAGIAGATDAGFSPFSLSGALTSGTDSVGGLFGDPTLGTDISSGFSNLTPSWLGGTSSLSSPGNSLASDYSAGSADTSPIASAGRDAIASTASTPSSSVLSGYLPTGSGAAAGGGTPGGFLTDTGTGISTGESSLPWQQAGYVNPSGGVGTGIGGAQSQPSFLSSFTSPGNTGGFNYDISGNPAGASSYGISDQFANAGSSAPSGTSFLNNPLQSITNGAKSVLSPANLLGGAAKSGLSYLLQKNNQGGYNALQGAGTQQAANYQPFLTAGQGATNTLSDLYGLNGQAAANAATQNWQNTPGYQFALTQGLQGIDAGAASRGMLSSGNTLNAEQQYGTGLANQYYNQYLQNLQGQQNAGLQGAQGVSAGQGNAAGAYAAGKGNQASNYNSLIGGLASSLFPQQGFSINGMPLTYNSGQGGLLSYL